MQKSSPCSMDQPARAPEAWLNCVGAVHAWVVLFHMAFVHFQILCQQAGCTVASSTTGMKWYELGKLDSKHSMHPSHALSEHANGKWYHVSAPAAR
jgi:hypothetical protein